MADGVAEKRLKAGAVELGERHRNRDGARGAGEISQGAAGVQETGQVFLGRDEGCRAALARAMRDVASRGVKAL